MNYRLLEVASFYPKYLEDFYKKNSIDSLSYEQHYQLLMNDCFAECDFIHPELQRMGNATKLIVYNDVKLQKKWKEDYRESSLFEILCAQVKDFKPDVIFFSDITMLNLKQYKIVKELSSYKCIFVGWHFTTINNVIKEILPCFDQIYTGNKYTLSLLEPICKNVKLLYHGFATKLLDIVPEIPRENKLVFPGSIFIGEEIHNNRIDMFGNLYRTSIPFEFYGNIYGSFVPYTIKQKIKWMLNPNKPSDFRIETEKKLLNDIKPSVFGLDYYKILNKYSVCINQHAAIAKTGSGNMRMFEATGMGSCLLTDYREENCDLFIPDEEIVVYHNYEELVEKAKYLIDNPSVTAEIAKKGQKRTMEAHSYKIKAEKMNEYIIGLLK